MVPAELLHITLFVLAAPPARGGGEQGARLHAARRALRDCAAAIRARFGAASPSASLSGVRCFGSSGKPRCERRGDVDFDFHSDDFMG